MGVWILSIEKFGVYLSAYLQEGGIVMPVQFIEIRATNYAERHQAVETGGILVASVTQSDMSHQKIADILDGTFDQRPGVYQPTVLYAFEAKGEVFKSRYSEPLETGISRYEPCAGVQYVSKYAVPHVYGSRASKYL
jgi:hypothetical protein